MVHQHQFLAHQEGDAVAVAVCDASPGEVPIGFLDGGSATVHLREDISLGHKVALRDIPSGSDVIEYGLRIGIASADISQGQHVHIHNVRSARWQTSVA